MHPKPSLLLTRVSASASALVQGQAFGEHQRIHTGTGTRSSFRKWVLGVPNQAKCSFLAPPSPSLLHQKLPSELYDWAFPSSFSPG